MAHASEEESERTPAKNAQLIDVIPRAVHGRNMPDSQVERAALLQQLDLLGYSRLPFLG